MKHAATAAQAARQLAKQPAAPPDARAYLSIIDSPAFLRAVADGNAGAVEEFHNDGVGKLNKVLLCLIASYATTAICFVCTFFSTATVTRLPRHHRHH